MDSDRHRYAFILTFRQVKSDRTSTGDLDSCYEQAGLMLLSESDALCQLVDRDLGFLLVNHLIDIRSSDLEATSTDDVEGRT